MPARRRSSRDYDDEEFIEWPKVRYYLKWNNNQVTQKEIAEEQRFRRQFYKSPEYQKRFTVMDRFWRYMADGRRRLTNWYNH